MNCQTAHDYLQQTLDGTPVESPQWAEHLRACPECRSLADAARRLQDGLRRLPAPTPPPDLAARIADRVLRDRRSRRAVRRRWAVSLALAAGLFLALTLRLDWRGRAPTPPAQTTEPAAQASPKEGGTPPEAPPTLSESAAELGEVFASLRSHTADETLGRTRRLVSGVPSPALPKVELQPVEPPTRPLREAGEGVSAGLEPVTTSARRAVGLFLRELPGEADAKGL